MFLGNVAEIFAPMQIMVVLVLALLLFGPKRLPELGKSLGSALRDLNKAKNDMMKSFSLDHDADRYSSDTPYTNSYDNSYNSNYTYNPVPDPPDLSDYMMAGVPPKDTRAITGTVARDGGSSYDPAESVDYTILPSGKLTEKSEAAVEA